MINRRNLLKWGASCLPLVSTASVLSRQTRSDSADLVRILEHTPRDKLPALLVAKKTQGMTEFDLFTAICLAGARNIEPYPSVGFKYHAVMMMHAVHLTRTQSTNKRYKWLPLLWSADQFKSAQIQDLRGGDWQIAPIEEKLLPASPRVAFIQAMERWDAAAADMAIVALSRRGNFDDIFELLFHFGARDLRDIGHKTIAVSNCHRVLKLIGWQHRENMLRSTVYALLNHGNERNPATSDLEADRAGRINVELIRKFPTGWQQGRMDHKVTLELNRALATQGAEQIGLTALEILQDKIHPQVLWDATFIAVAQMIMQQSSIVAVHGTTTINALNFAFRNAQQAETQAFMLLQSLSFVTWLRSLLRGRKRNIQFESFEPVATNEQQPEQEVFNIISQDRALAAAKMLHHLQAGGSDQHFMQAARMLIVDRNVGYHDYKFTEASFENYSYISSRWRDRYLCASVFYLNGSQDKPNRVVTTFKELLG
jgi:hypothetical protein